MLFVVAVLCTLVAAQHGFGDGLGRRYVGAVPLLLGMLVLAIATMMSARLDGPGPSVLVLGVVVSVGLGWWGYHARRS